MVCSLMKVEDWEPLQPKEYALGVICDEKFKHAGLLAVMQNRVEYIDISPGNLNRTDYSVEDIKGQLRGSLIAEVDADIHQEDVYANIISILSVVETIIKRMRDGSLSRPPYSLNFSFRKLFDEITGIALDITDAEGFTCSTFVEGIFRYVDLPLLKVDEWPESSENYDFLKSVEKRMSADMPSFVGSGDGKAVRVRPIETFAGAACYANRPLTHQFAKVLAEKILAVVGGPIKNAVFCTDCPLPAASSLEDSPSQL